MEKKEQLKFYKFITITSVLIILILAVVGVVICQNRKSDGYVAYAGDEYMMRLNGDGTFSLGWLPSSFAVAADPEAPNLYRWDGDMLVLEYGDSVGVLYFRKKGDALVFQKEQSVLPEDPYYSLNHLYDGITLKKIDQ